MIKALVCGAGGFIGGHLVNNDVLLYCENAYPRRVKQDKLISGAEAAQPQREMVEYLPGGSNDTNSTKYLPGKAGKWRLNI